MEEAAASSFWAKFLAGPYLSPTGVLTITRDGFQRGLEIPGFLAQFWTIPKMRYVNGQPPINYKNIFNSMSLSKEKR